MARACINSARNHLLKVDVNLTQSLKKIAHCQTYYYCQRSPGRVRPAIHNLTYLYAYAALAPNGCTFTGRIQAQTDQTGQRGLKLRRWVAPELIYHSLGAASVFFFVFFFQTTHALKKNISSRCQICKGRRLFKKTTTRHLQHIFLSTKPNNPPAPSPPVPSAVA